jgi:hypothetical protein
MRNILIVAFTVIILNSCTPIRFDTLPGEKSNDIPPDIHGTYLLKESYFFKNDSFLVRIEPTSITLEKNNERQTFYIDNDFLVSKFDKYIVFGRFDDEIKSLVNIMLVEPENGDLKLYLIYSNALAVNQPQLIEKYLPRKQSHIENLHIEPPVSGNTPVISAGVATPNQSTIYYYGMDNMLFDLFLKEEKNKLKPIMLYNTKKSAIKKK